MPHYMSLRADVAATMLREAAMLLNNYDDDCPVGISLDFYTLRTLDLSRQACDIRRDALDENEKRSKRENT